MANTFGEFRIGKGLLAQRVNAFHQIGSLLFKTCHAAWVARIEHIPICKHNLHTIDGAIRVLRRTAAHAAGIIGRNTADFTGVDGSGIGADFALKQGKVLESISANHAKLQANFQTLV